MPAPLLLKPIAGADDNGVTDADRDVNRDAHQTLGRPLPDSYPTLPVLLTDVAIASN
jgi:hypothetical protein